jgi:beta-phosphoglucomutase-like phosphatase (HAD superfamily)
VLFYDEEKVAAIKPYPHVAETLPALRDRGLRLAVVTDAHKGKRTVPNLKLRHVQVEAVHKGFVLQNMNP